MSGSYILESSKSVSLEFSSKNLCTNHEVMCIRHPVCIRNTMHLAQATEHWLHHLFIEDICWQNFENKYNSIICEEWILQYTTNFDQIPYISYLNTWKPGPLQHFIGCLCYIESMVLNMLSFWLHQKDGHVNNVGSVFRRKTVHHTVFTHLHMYWHGQETKLEENVEIHLALNSSVLCCL